MVCTIAAAIVAGATVRQQSPPCDVFCHAQLARRAEAAGNVAEYQRHVRIIGSLAPSHPGVVYAIARAFMFGREPDSALAALGVMARIGDTRDPNDDSLFTTV